MKKGLTVIVLAMVAALAMCFAGCSGADDGYDEAKESLVSSIDAMNESAYIVANVELNIWSVTGADYFAQFLLKMLSSTSSQEYLDNFVNVGDATPDKEQLDEWQDSIIGTSLRDAQSKGESAVTQEQDRAFSYMEAFRDEYYGVHGQSEELRSQIEDFKAKYETSHKESVDLVAEYCQESIDFASSVLIPSGSLASFSSSVKEHKSNLNALRNRIK